MRGIVGVYTCMPLQSKMPDRYGSVKVKALKALSDMGALSVRELCITTGIEYRVMAVSVLKWLKQGMIIRGKRYCEYRGGSVVAYKLSPGGRRWLADYKSQYSSYLAELKAWRDALTIPLIDRWLSMGFTEFQLHFSGFVGVSSK